MTDEYDDIIEKAAKMYGHEVWFIKAIIEVESGGNPNAISPVGAIGLMQIMPATGEDLKLSKVDLLDPVKNIWAGCHYLFNIRRWLRQKELMQKLSLAAYNGGIGNVRKYAGVPPFKETRDYIKKVMKHKPA